MRIFVYQNTPNTVWVYITHSPPSPPPPKKKKRKKKRRLVKMTQRYMLTIVGPGMFDFDI